MKNTFLIPDKRQRLLAERRDQLPLYGEKPGMLSWLLGGRHTNEEITSSKDSNRTLSLSVLKVCQLAFTSIVFWVKTPFGPSPVFSVVRASA